MLALARVRCRGWKSTADRSLPDWICVDDWPSKRRLTQIGVAPGLGPAALALGKVSLNSEPCGVRVLLTGYRTVPNLTARYFTNEGSRKVGQRSLCVGAGSTPGES